MYIRSADFNQRGEYSVSVETNKIQIITMIFHPLYFIENNKIRVSDGESEAKKEQTSGDKWESCPSRKYFSTYQDPFKSLCFITWIFPSRAVS